MHCIRMESFVPSLQFHCIFFLCKPVLIQIMSWCWIASMTPNRVIMPQWVKWYSGVNQRSCQLLRSDFTTWIRYLHPHDHGMWLLIDLLNKRLQWRHNGRERVSNHQPHDCLLNHLFSPRWKKTSKLRVTGLCAGNSPVTGEFPAQMASDAENVSIWWCHHATPKPMTNFNIHQMHTSMASIWQKSPRLTGIGIPIINLRRSDYRLRPMMGTN